MQLRHNTLRLFVWNNNFYRKLHFHRKTCLLLFVEGRPAGSIEGASTVTAPPDVCPCCRLRGGELPGG